MFKENKMSGLINCVNNDIITNESQLNYNLFLNKRLTKPVDPVYLQVNMEDSNITNSLNINNLFTTIPVKSTLGYNVTWNTVVPSTNTKSSQFVINVNNTKNYVLYFYMNITGVNPIAYNFNLKLPFRFYYGGSLQSEKVITQSVTAGSTEILFSGEIIPKDSTGSITMFNKVVLQFETLNTTNAMLTSNSMTVNMSITFVKIN